MQLPMICDSCALRMSPATCAAFPEEIPLNAMRAERHDEPRPDQENDLVYEFDSRKALERDAFDKFREALGSKAL